MSDSNGSVVDFATRILNVCFRPITATASSTGIDASRLAAIEAGQIEPTGDEILILAESKEASDQ